MIKTNFAFTEFFKQAVGLKALYCSKTFGLLKTKA